MNRTIWPSHKSVSWLLLVVLLLILLTASTQVTVPASSSIAQAAGTRWEYKVVDLTPVMMDLNAMTQLLNTNGQEGWEMVGTATYTSVYAVFKRPS